MLLPSIVSPTSRLNICSLFHLLCFIECNCTWAWFVWMKRAKQTHKQQRHRIHQFTASFRNVRFSKKHCHLLNATNRRAGIFSFSHVCLFALLCIYQHVCNVKLFIPKMYVWENFSLRKRNCTICMWQQDSSKITGLLWVVRNWKWGSSCVCWCCVCRNVWKNRRCALHLRNPQPKHILIPNWIDAASFHETNRHATVHGVM